MLFETGIKLLGGLWRVKTKCQRCPSFPGQGFYRLLYTKALQAKGSWISWDATFKSIPCFPHGINGIFISGGVVIGHSCIIFQQVTIGSNTLIDSQNLGAPSVGDHCYIGVGAKIIGKVVIGQRCRIGANAVVYRDIADNTVVTTGEQRMIHKERPLNNRFYHMYNYEWRYFENGTWVKETDPQIIDLLSQRFPLKARE